MRSKLGMGLGYLGAFLVVLAILLQVWARGALYKTPLDVNSVTRLAGTATLAGPAGEETFPVKVTSKTFADSAKSDDNVVVFTNSSCVVRDEGDVGDCVSNDDPEQRLVTASTDDFATDRVSGVAVNDPQYLPAAATPHEGLVNKWPFNAEKRDYDYWSGTVGDTVTAAYTGTEDIDGLETYVYEVTIEDAPIEMSGVDALYNDAIRINVEPVTGAIVNQSSEQTRTDTSGNLILGLNAAFTEDQMATSVDEAKSNKSKLQLVSSTLPLIGYIVGIPMLLVGIWLSLMAARDEDARGYDYGDDGDDDSDDSDDTKTDLQKA